MVPTDPAATMRLDAYRARSMIEVSRRQ